MLTPEQIAAEALAKYLAEQNGGGSSATTYGSNPVRSALTNQYFQMGSNGIRRNVGTPASPPQPSQDAQALAAYYQSSSITLATLNTASHLAWR